MMKEIERRANGTGEEKPPHCRIVDFVDWGDIQGGKGKCVTAMKK